MSKRRNHQKNRTNSFRNTHRRNTSMARARRPNYLYQVTDQPTENRSYFRNKRNQNNLIPFPGAANDGSGPPSQDVKLGLKIRNWLNQNGMEIVALVVIGIVMAALVSGVLGLNKENAALRQKVDDMQTQVNDMQDEFMPKQFMQQTVDALRAMLQDEMKLNKSEMQRQIDLLVQRMESAGKEK